MNLLLGIIAVGALLVVQPTCAQSRRESSRPPSVFDGSSGHLVTGLYPAFEPGGVTVTYIEADKMPPQVEVRIGGHHRSTTYWIHQGDVITLFGAFYRVESVSVRPNNVRFRRLPEDQIPSGLAAEPNSIIIPLNAASYLHGKYVWLDTIAAPDDNSPREAAVYTPNFLGRQRIGGRLVMGPKHCSHGKQVLAVGDELVIDGGRNYKEDRSAGLRKHKVLRIVPADPKHRVPGWIEIKSAHRYKRHDWDQWYERP